MLLSSYCVLSVSAEVSAYACVGELVSTSKWMTLRPLCGIVTNPPKPTGRRELSISDVYEVECCASLAQLFW
jgi:hypothetical protein